MMEVIKVRTAVKPHVCSDCQKTIVPGERYMEEVVAPWTQIADDVDDEGRTIGSPLGEWLRIRRHMKCYDKMMYGWL